MNKILPVALKTFLLSFGIIAISLFPLYSAHATGVDVVGTSCKKAGGTQTGNGSICGAAAQDDFNKLMSNIINTILTVLGMIAVVMIIIGGIRYTTSNGESSQIKSAKDTILYAVIGLIVAILAYAIVNFVLAAFIKK